MYENNLEKLRYIRRQSFSVPKSPYTDKNYIRLIIITSFVAPLTVGLILRAIDNYINKKKNK